MRTVATACIAFAEAAANVVEVDASDISGRFADERGLCSWTERSRDAKKESLSRSKAEILALSKKKRSKRKAK